MRTHAKRPDETLTVTLDFSDFIARVGDEAVITYNLRADLGITVEANSSTPGVFEITLSGGDLGRAYSFGIEAETAEGESKVQLHRIRLRETANTWDSVPVVGAIGGGNNAIYLVDADGNFLADSLGQVLYLE